MLPLAVVTEEVAPTGLGDFEVSLGVLDSLNTRNLVRVTLRFTLHISLGVLAGFLDVTGNIEGVARGFGDRETVVERDATRDGTEADDYTPHLIDREPADTAALGRSGSSQEGLFEARGDDKGNHGGGELANTLHSENRTHHGAPPFRRRELGSDDGT